MRGGSLFVGRFKMAPLRSAILSGKLFLDFGLAECLRAFRQTIFTDGAVTENGFCMASVSIAIRRCPALPEGVQQSPWEKGKHPHPLSQILRICQLPRKGELLTHPQGLHFIWKLHCYCKKLPLRGSWRTNVSLRGFNMLNANEKAYSTAPHFRRKRRCKCCFPLRPHL